MFHKPLSPTARRLVCFGLTAPSVLVTVACVFTFQDLGRMETAFGWVRHALQVENRIHQLVLNVHQFDGNQRAYLFTGRRSYRESFSSAEAGVPVDLAALGQDIAADPVQRQRFLELEQVVLQRSGVAWQAVELKKAGQHDAAHKLARSELGQDGNIDTTHTISPSEADRVMAALASDSWEAERRVER
jgi:CHASE3 domain sensor protein